MNQNIEITEKDAIDFLMEVAKANGQPTPRVIIVSRLVPNAAYSAQRTVRLALVTTTNNEALLNALIKACLLEENNDIYFVGSDVNLQTDLEVDYLYFETKIFIKQG